MPNKEKYAVVRIEQEGNSMKFALWHDTYQRATDEAERLCRKERAQFGVLKLMAVCSVNEIPVTWTEFGNVKE
jgi:hypothetical protein